jgi:type I restriction enzyme M protein
MCHGDRFGLIWSITELLRHDCKPSEHGRVVLPFTVLRRLDGWLAPTREKVLERHGRSRTASPTTCAT